MALSLDFLTTNHWRTLPLGVSLVLVSNGGWKPPLRIGGWKPPSLNRILPSVGAKVSKTGLATLTPIFCHFVNATKTKSSANSQHELTKKGTSEKSEVPLISSTVPSRVS